MTSEPPAEIWLTPTCIGCFDFAIAQEWSIEKPLRCEECGAEPTLYVLHGSDSAITPCTTCGDRGWIDERTGGAATSGYAECPDCCNPHNRPLGWFKP